MTILTENTPALPEWRIENFAHVTRGDGDNISAHFASLSSLYACADACNGNPDDCASRLTTDVRIKWTGTEDYAAAAALAQTGWAEGAKKIAKARRELEPHIKPARAIAQRRRLQSHYSVAGEGVDMGRYIQGNPECMVDYRHQVKMRSTRIVTLLVSCSCSSNISNKQIINRGACIAAAVELLEMAGLAVEVIIANAVKSRNHSICQQSVIAKPAGERLDTAQLAYILAHPSFLRRTMFSVKEKFSEDIREEYGFSVRGSYYGFPTYTTYRNATLAFAAPLVSTREYTTAKDAASRVQSLIQEHLT